MRDILSRQLKKSLIRNFLTDAVVFRNGTPLSTRLVSSNQLLAMLGETELTILGLIPVYIRTGGLNSNKMAFDVTAQ